MPGSHMVSSLAGAEKQHVLFFSLSNRTSLQPLTVSPLTRRVALEPAEKVLTDWYRDTEPEVLIWWKRRGSRMHDLDN